MDIKEIREAHANLLKAIGEAGITLTESQKQAFDGFVDKLESKLNEVKDNAILKTRKSVTEAMNRKFKAAFDSYQKHSFENATLTRLIQEKVDEIKESKANAEEYRKYLGQGKPVVDTKDGPIFAEYHPETNEIWYGSVSNTGLIPDGKMKCTEPSVYDNIEKLNDIIGDKYENILDEGKKAGADEILESVDQFLDTYIEEVLPKKTIVDYAKMKSLEESVKRMEKENGEFQTLKESNESLKAENDKLKATIAESEKKTKVAEEKENKAKALALLESKLEDIPSFEAKKLREKLSACGTEAEIQEKFDNELDSIRKEMEEQKNASTGDAEGGQLNLEDEINSILEVSSEEKTTKDADGKSGLEGIDADGSEMIPPDEDPSDLDEDIYDEDGELLESSGEFDRIDSKVMDYYIAKLEESYKYAR